MKIKASPSAELPKLKVWGKRNPHRLRAGWKERESHPQKTPKCWVWQAPEHNLKRGVEKKQKRTSR